MPCMTCVLSQPPATRMWVSCNIMCVLLEGKRMQLMQVMQHVSRYLSGCGGVQSAFAAPTLPSSMAVIFIFAFSLSVGR
jgi:hypothetical protein